MWMQIMWVFTVLMDDNIYIVHWNLFDTVTETHSFLPSKSNDIFAPLLCCLHLLCGWNSLFHYSVVVLKFVDVTFGGCAHAPVLIGWCGRENRTKAPVSHVCSSDIVSTWRHVTQQQLQCRTWLMVAEETCWSTRLSLQHKNDRL